MRNGFDCSELESMVLAMLAEGVTSGYAMRKRMSKMWGGRWSTESGSIYRALKRLETGKLIFEAGKGGSPNRQRTEYALTEKGRQVAFGWLAETPLTDDFQTIADSIRARTYFLDLLDAPTRKKVVKTWIAQNREFSERLKSELSKNANEQNSMWHIAQANLLALAEARQDWLRKLQNNVANA